MILEGGDWSWLPTHHLGWDGRSVAPVAAVRSVWLHCQLSPTVPSPSPGRKRAEGSSAGRAWAGAQPLPLPLPGLSGPLHGIQCLHQSFVQRFLLPVEVIEGNESHGGWFKVQRVLVLALCHERPSGSGWGGVGWGGWKALWGEQDAGRPPAWWAPG